MDRYRNNVKIKMRFITETLYLRIRNRKICLSMRQDCAINLYSCNNLIKIFIQNVQKVAGELTVEKLAIAEINFVIQSRDHVNVLLAGPVASKHEKNNLKKNSQSDKIQIYRINT